MSTRGELVRIETKLGSVKRNYELFNKVILELNKRVGHTIFSIWLVMFENWKMSSVFTTTAGVVKKNRTMNKQLFIRNDLKYQNRDGIAKFPLLKRLLDNIERITLNK